MSKKLEEDIDVTELYKEIYREEGITQVELAEKLGFASQSGIAAMLHKGAKLTHLYKMLKVLNGYRLVVEKVSPKGRVTKRYIIGE